jgi:hypothetical protein
MDIMCASLPTGRQEVERPTLWRYDGDSDDNNDDINML